MSDDRKQQVSETIDAPPERIFALLADPGRHTELDAAGMLRGVEGGGVEGGGGPVTAVGDAFVMNMDQDGIGQYQMRNEIVAFEADRKIAWAPSIHPPGSLSHVIGELDPSGHHWSWELEPAGEGRTTVTHTYDWSGVTDENALPLYPRVTPEQMSGTLGRLSDSVR